MNKTIQHNGVTWINLVSPSAKEISELSEEYDLHPLVAEELTSLTMRSKVDIYSNNLYFVLHFPSGEEVLNREIDFEMGKNFLITVQYSQFESLERILKNVSTKEEVKEKLLGGKPSALIFTILKELYQSALHKIDQIYIKTNKIEEKIFDGHEKENVKNISFLKRDILDFQGAFYLHDNVLASFEQAFKQGEHKDFFDPDFENELSSLIGENSQIKNLIQNIKETIDTLHSTNESLLTTKTNGVMKTLTIMAFITFPLMLLSSVFGMNTISTPIVGIKGDFWIITLAMIGATFGMFMFFKSKKWL